MTLKKELLQGIYSYGFERPSAVQQRVIMPVMKGERKNGGDGKAAQEPVG
jgi:superfamily II DNA/RNA helicase